MTTSPAAGDALEKLVNQFTDPLSFYRELVQNSIDAGGTEVEIRLEHRDGVMRIHVDDWGEGMNREIIDSRLTRLFSSRKDGDLDKIGKFGIGFVSVFAIDPDVVSVDTSRDGEDWRVVFHADRAFTRIARDEPVEGTKITIFKQATEDEYEAFLARSRDVVTYWCRFVDAEIRFQGQRVSRPFGLDSPCQVRHAEEGTEVVVGYRRNLQPMLGLFNRGLTLLETVDPSLSRSAAVLVDSRYLEHTMARDDVRQDENFAHVMAIARQLLDDALPHRLETLLREALGQRDAPDFGFLCRALAREIGPEREWRWGAADLAHGGGHQEDDDWVAVPGEDRCDQANRLLHGPYERDLPEGLYQAHWWISLEGDEPSGDGVTLDVFDAAAASVLATRELRVRDLEREGELERISLPFRCPAEASIELRIRWHETSIVRTARVAITSGERRDIATTPFPKLPLFVTASGAPATLGEVARRSERGELYLELAVSDLGRRVEEEGRGLVLVLGADDPRLVVLEAIAGDLPPLVERRFVLPQPAREHHEGWEPLRLALVDVLQEAGAKVSTAVLGQLVGPGADQWAAVSVDHLGELTALDDAGRLGAGLLSSKRTLVVNTAHGAVPQLLALGRTEPEISAYLLAKLFYLRTELAPVQDARLATAAWNRRWTRSNA